MDYLGVSESENADSLLKEFEAEQLSNIRLRSEIAKIKKQVQNLINVDRLRKRSVSL